MPAALIPIIEVVSAVVGAAGTGYSLYNAVTGGGGGSGTDAAAQQQQLQADQQKQQDQLNAAKAQLIRRQAGNVQSQTGGALTTDAFDEMMANLAGYPGSANLLNLSPGNPADTTSSGIALPSTSGAGAGSPGATGADYSQLAMAKAGGSPEMPFSPEFISGLMGSGNPEYSIYGGG